MSTETYKQEHMKNATILSSPSDVINFCFDAVKIDGLFCEFGVYKGGSVNYIAEKTAKTIHGFDSFEGLPEDWREGYPKGAFAMEQPPEVKPNVKIHKGWFVQTIPPFLLEYKDPVAFLHIDCDLYSSTKTVLNLFKPRIVAGTVIIFDEYFNYDDWENGEYKAFQEFVIEHDIRHEYLCYNDKHEQVGIIIK